ncbi:unnamed protein product, partial [Allacma fusca]
MNILRNLLSSLSVILAVIFLFTGESHQTPARFARQASFFQRGSIFFPQAITTGRVGIARPAPVGVAAPSSIGIA